MDTFKGGVYEYIQEHSWEGEILTEAQFEEYFELAFQRGKGKRWLMWWCPICDDLVSVKTLSEDPEKGWFIECLGDHEPKRFWIKEATND